MIGKKYTYNPQHSTIPIINVILTEWKDMNLEPKNEQRILFPISMELMKTGTRFSFVIKTPEVLEHMIKYLGYGDKNVKKNIRDFNVHIPVKIIGLKMPWRRKRKIITTITKFPAENLHLELDMWIKVGEDFIGSIELYKDLTNPENMITKTLIKINGKRYVEPIVTALFEGIEISNPRT